MSRGLNKVMLIGHLGKDPELTYTPNGTAVARFSLATSERRKSAEGQWEDYTEWHKIVTFGKTAETAGQYLSKGKQVYLEGRISTRSYDKDGQKQWWTEVIAYSMILLGARGEGGPRPPEERDYSRADDRYTQAPPPDSEVDEDLPF